MVTLAQRFNWGQNLIDSQPQMFRRLNEAYTNTAQVVNMKISKYSTSGVDAPANSSLNRNFEIGDVYVRTDTNTAWMMTSRTTDVAVTWTLIT